MTLIRKMQPEDFPAVYRLIKQLAETMEEPYLIAPEQLKDILQDTDSRPDVYLNLVAEEPDGVAGMISLVFFHVLCHAGGTALINELVVDPAYRRKGIGAKLIAEAMKAAQARGMDEIDVGTERVNLTAQQFYRRCGFDREFILMEKEFE